jgi:hypothetical protein
MEELLLEWLEENSELFLTTEVTQPSWWERFWWTGETSL